MDSREFWEPLSISQSPSSVLFYMWHREEKKFKAEKGPSDFKKDAFQKHRCLN